MGKRSRLVRILVAGLIGAGLSEVVRAKCPPTADTWDLTLVSVKRVDPGTEDTASASSDSRGSDPDLDRETEEWTTTGPFFNVADGGEASIAITPDDFLALQEN